MPDRLRSEVAALGRPAELAELERVLDLLESPLAGLVLSRRARPFSALPPAERERVLLGWAESRIPLRRAAFQVLKRLTLLYTYGTPGSPYWSILGYTRPVLDPPAPPPALRLRVPAAGETVDADVCVIGSGAGGAVAAAVLAAAGRQVVVLERAAPREEAAFDGAELAGYAALFHDRGIAATADRAVALLAGSAVGGGTVVNWSTSLRLPAAVREEWLAAGIDGDLDRHFEAVEERIGVNVAESPRNVGNGLLERGLLALGLDRQTVRRNARGCGDCGHCTFGCRRGAKRSAARTYLADACADGAEVLARCEARRVLHAGARVLGVAARVPGGEVRIRAPLVVLAAGALVTPALLLRSGIATDRAGRGLALHPVCVTFGTYDERTLLWSGVPQSVLSEEFAGVEGAFGFRIECGSAYPGLIGATVSWSGGADHRALVAEAAHTAPFLGIVRDGPRGRVRVDRSGEPRVDYSPGSRERRLLTRAMRELLRIHVAAGARRISTLHTPRLAADAGDAARLDAEIERRGISPNRVGLFSAHQMASCAIAADARRGVADPDGRVRGVRGLVLADASAFPSSSGVNPMLTVMALARRTAGRAIGS